MESSDIQNFCAKKRKENNKRCLRSVPIFSDKTRTEQSNTASGAQTPSSHLLQSFGQNMALADR